MSRILFIMAMLSLTACVPTQFTRSDQVPGQLEQDRAECARYIEFHPDMALGVRNLRMAQCMQAKGWSLKS
jgi:hypothetical protein